MYVNSLCAAGLAELDEPPADLSTRADQRGGIYKLPMPYTLGNESAGVVVAVGEGVDEATSGYKVGDRVVVRLAGSLWRAEQCR